jgi:hypothetical protein
MHRLKLTGPQLKGNVWFYLEAPLLSTQCNKATFIAAPLAIDIVISLDSIIIFIYTAQNF